MCLLAWCHENCFTQEPPVQRRGSPQLAFHPPRSDTALARHSRSVLDVPWRFEEQTGPLALSDHVTQIATMGCIPVVLKVLPAGAIRQSVPEFARPFPQLVGDFFRVVQERHNRVHLALQDAGDSSRRVVAGSDGAAGLFYSGDGGTGRLGDDDVDRSAQLLSALEYRY